MSLYLGLRVLLIVAAKQSIVFDQTLNDLEMRKRRQTPLDNSR
jgi:hypothetical protein